MEQRTRRQHATVLFVAWAACVVPGARAATIVVTTTSDELNADGDCSLREAIQSANTDTAVSGCVAGSGADTILLASPAYYGIGIAGANENANQSGDFDLASPITIKSAGGAVLSGELQDRIFDVLAGAVVRLRGLTILDGVPFASGGGIYNSGTLVIEECTVSDNTAVAGGGIKNDSQLTILRSTISNNVASSGGGGISSSTGERVILIDSVVQGNQAATGGGLLVGGLRMLRSTITDNDSTGDGGGVYKISGSLIDALVDSTVSGNHAHKNGGGVWVQTSAHLLLASSTVALNIADDDAGNDGQGGGLYVQSAGEVELANTIIALNQDHSSGMFAFYAPDCNGPVQSLGYNFFGELNLGGTVCVITGNTTGNQIGWVGSPIDPKLGPLTASTWLTPTHAPLADSPVLDAANPAGCVDELGATLGLDQRRYLRVVDGPDGDTIARCDIGAHEGGSVASIFGADFEAGVTDDWSEPYW